MPHIEIPDIQILNEEDAAAVLKALESEPLKYKTMIHMALSLGCRRGELMALHFCDINFETSTVKIEHSAYKVTGESEKLKEPKNRSSIRNISIPQYVLDLLTMHHKEQTEERLKLGDQWHEQGYVFTTWNGEIMNVDTPSTWFPDFLKRHNLPHMKFHALRHSSATLLLYGGANIKEVSSRLGHAQLATTNRYLHALRPADQAAADTFNGMFGKKSEKKSEQV